MATLKNSIINRILKCLDHGSFIIEDFDCQFESNSSELARITFKALPKYIFVLSENYSSNPFGLTLENFSRGSSNKIISTTKIPGSYKNYEETTHENIDLAIDSVSAWVENIVDDLTNSRLLLSPAIDELSEDFQNSIDENIEDPESYFEEDEKNEMRSKLDKIHERVVELEKKWT